MNLVVAGMLVGAVALASCADPPAVEERLGDSVSKPIYACDGVHCSLNGYTTMCDGQREGCIPGQCCIDDTVHADISFVGGVPGGSIDQGAFCNAYYAAKLSGQTPKCTCEQNSDGPNHE